MGIMAGAGLRKEDVNYRQHEQCSRCDHFYPANSCDIVDGNISSENVCDKWEIKAQRVPKDGKFYQELYNKEMMKKVPSQGANE